MELKYIIFLVIYLLYWLKLGIRLAQARMHGLKFFDSVSNSTWFTVFLMIHAIALIVLGMAILLKHVIWVAG